MIVVKFVDADGKVTNIATAEKSLAAKRVVEEDARIEKIDPSEFFVDENQNVCWNAPEGGMYVIENLVHWS